MELFCIHVKNSCSGTCLCVNVLWPPICSELLPVAHTTLLEISWHGLTIHTQLYDILALDKNSLNMLFTHGCTCSSKTLSLYMYMRFLYFITYAKIFP